MVAVPGGLLGHGMACGLAREHTGVLVSVCEDILAQGVCVRRLLHKGG